MSVQQIYDNFATGGGSDGLRQAAAYVASSRHIARSGPRLAVLEGTHRDGVRCTLVRSPSSLV